MSPIVFPGFFIINGLPLRVAKWCHYLLDRRFHFFSPLIVRLTYTFILTIWFSTVICFAKDIQGIGPRLARCNDCERAYLRWQKQRNGLPETGYKRHLEAAGDYRIARPSLGGPMLLGRN